MKNNNTFFTWLFDGGAWCDLVGRVIFIFGVGYMVTIVPIYYAKSELSKSVKSSVTRLMFWR